MNKEYPYYIIPCIEALPQASGRERLALARRIAAAVGDPVALRAIIGIDPEEFLSFYPDMQSPQLSTDDTIDAFLQRFGSPTAQGPEKAVACRSLSSGDSRTDHNELDDLIQPVAVPYDLSSLEELPELPASSPLFPEEPQSDLPDQSDLSEQSEQSDQSPRSPRSPRSAQQPLPLSESLARIMIKNGNYQKALEIIKEISLNNPKKSIYFADQIRFLEKLIALKASPKSAENRL